MSNKIKAYAPNPTRSWWLVWNPETKDWITDDYLYGALWRIAGIEDYKTITICGRNALGDELDVGVEVPIAISILSIRT